MTLPAYFTPELVLGHPIMEYCEILQGSAERNPRFGRGIDSGWERVVKQRCTCRFQCTPWRGQENIEPLLLRSL